MCATPFVLRVASSKRFIEGFNINVILTKQLERWTRFQRFNKRISLEIDSIKTHSAL